MIGDVNETRKAINTNHRDLCKFADAEDPNFRSVLGAIVDYVVESTMPGMSKQRLTKDITNYAVSATDKVAQTQEGTISSSSVFSNSTTTLNEKPEDSVHKKQQLPHYEEGASHLGVSPNISLLAMLKTSRRWI